MIWSNHTQKIFTIIIYDNKYQGTILDYPFVILSHIAKVSSLVRYDSGMVCLPQQSPVLNESKASPKYFHIGDRKENITHCQMRNDASHLNLHLQQHHLSDRPSCPHCKDWTLLRQADHSRVVTYKGWNFCYMRQYYKRVV
jgi:hypothetical protein